MLALGAMLLFNGLHLTPASRRSKSLCPAILYFIAGDFLRIGAALLLVVLGLVITSTEVLWHPAHRLNGWRFLSDASWYALGIYAPEQGANASCREDRYQ